MALKVLVAALAAPLILSAPAAAQEWYIGGSIGLNAQNDSDNSGQTGAFTTGNLGDGSTLDVADGTPYGWSTEFDQGMAVSGEFGARYDSGLRSGVEIAYTNADVDTHTNVSLGGGSIDAVDAAALAGAPDPLGVTVGDLVSDGQGEISSTSLFVNAYYDFARGQAIEPYLGVGIGISDVEVEYQPSGVGIINDGETKFAYQIKVGATFRATDRIDLYGEYAYRATEDIEVDNALFPGTLEIENQQNIFAIGARYRFG